MLIGKNNRKIAKKALCLIFAFLLSINSFAAIVSDNDGSAFVSKSEFEALKKDFADQVDNYNDSIDRKIDGAIASYLAGFNIAKKTSVNLISNIDTTKRNGYRAYQKGGNIFSANCVNNEWMIDLSSAVCYRGAWVDINTGEVESLWADQAKTTKTLPSGTNNPWYVGQPDHSPPMVKVQGGWPIMPVGVQVLSGTTTMVNSAFTSIFVDKNGVVDEFSNKKSVTIDMRAARGITGATDDNRWFLLSGTALGAFPPRISWNVNELFNGLPIICRNGQDSTGASGFGNVFTIVKEATIKLNPNIFCWNTTDGLCTAYDSKCEKVEINDQSACVSFNSATYRWSGTVTRLVWGASAYGRGYFPPSNMSSPWISFEHAGKNSNLPSTAFEAVSGFPYGRLKTRYLQLKDFKSIEDTSRHLYTYEGLPLHTADQTGELEFDIEIAKDRYVRPDISATVAWDDPSSTMKIRVKNKPFNQDDDYSDCLKIKINNTESTEGTIQADTKTHVSFEIEKGMTYYMRWYCEGYDYGGEIIFLGNAYEIATG